MPPRRRNIEPKTAAKPQVEWLHQSKGDSAVYSVTDTSALLAGHAGYSIVFLKPDTDAGQASGMIEKLDNAAGGDVASFGKGDGLNLQGKELPYLIVKGTTEQVKDLLAKAELTPILETWSALEQAPAAGYATERKHDGHPRGGRTHFGKFE